MRFYLQRHARKLYDTTRSMIFSPISIPLYSWRLVNESVEAPTLFHSSESSWSFTSSRKGNGILPAESSGSRNWLEILLKMTSNELSTGSICGSTEVTRSVFPLNSRVFPRKPKCLPLLITLYNTWKAQIVLFTQWGQKRERHLTPL